MKKFFSSPQQIILYISIITTIISLFGWAKSVGYNDNVYKNLRFESSAQTQKVIEWTNREDKLIFENDLDKKILDIKKEFYGSDTLILIRHNVDFGKLYTIIEKNAELNNSTNLIVHKLLDIQLKKNY